MAGGHPQPESINGRRGSQSAVRHTDGMGTGALPFSGQVAAGQSYPLTAGVTAGGSGLSAADQHGAQRHYR